jgi:purine-nucleoside phosphorylase
VSGDEVCRDAKGAGHMTYYNEVQEAVAFVEKAIGVLSASHNFVGLVLGSGLGEVADAIKVDAVIDYEQIPHMGSSTAPDHAGRFIAGTLFDVPVICMQGRLHLYEGNTSAQVAFPIFLMHELGATRIIVTNAAGAINTSYRVGDLSLISDHINYQGCAPFTNQLDPRLGMPFCDMTGAYSRRLRSAALSVAEQLHITLHEGVYVGVNGPSFETPAEIRMFVGWGADLVGMSTISEVIAARSCGMEVMGLSLCSNMAAGIDEETAICSEDINRVSAMAVNDVLALLGKILPLMGEDSAWKS